MTAKEFIEDQKWDLEIRHPTLSDPLRINTEWLAKRMEAYAGYRIGQERERIKKGLPPKRVVDAHGTTTSEYFDSGVNTGINICREKVLTLLKVDKPMNTQSKKMSKESNIRDWIKGRVEVGSITDWDGVKLYDEDPRHDHCVHVNGNRRQAQWIADAINEKLERDEQGKG